MVRKRKPYKVYTKEFKLEALRLMDVAYHFSIVLFTELFIERFG